jgi:hypothetical protein
MEGCGGVQYSTVQYSTVQYSTVQYNAAQYSAVQDTVVHSLKYSTVQYSLNPPPNTDSASRASALSLLNYSVLNRSSLPKTRKIRIGKTDEKEDIKTQGDTMLRPIE